MTPPALTVGSVCSGSPWLRSQAAHSFSNGVTLPAIVAEPPPPLREPPLVPEPLPVPGEELVAGSALAAEPAPVPGPELIPRLATCGALVPLLLQPASARAASASAAATVSILSAPRRRALLSELPFI